MPSPQKSLSLWHTTYLYTYTCATSLHVPLCATGELLLQPREEFVASRCTDIPNRCPIAIRRKVTTTAYIGGMWRAFTKGDRARVN